MCGRESRVTWIFSAQADEKADRVLRCAAEIRMAYSVYVHRPFCSGWIVDEARVLYCTFLACARKCAKYDAAWKGDDCQVLSEGRRERPRQKKISEICGRGVGNPGTSGDEVEISRHERLSLGGICAFWLN